jgi:hypothetical protein
MRGSTRPVRFRLVVGMAALALVAGACGGGGDDEEATEDTVALEDIEPIVDIDPCDLIDDTTASELSGADVEGAESTTEDDGTTTCDFAFADESVAEETGSALAASLSIGPGDEGDVPSGSSVARTLSMGDASAAEEDDGAVRVVYVVREVVVRVEIVPGDGVVDDELIDQVVEFTETTEPTVTEVVTGEPFVPDDTTTSTTEFEAAEEFEAGDELDEVTETLTVDRAGGLDEFTFEADANAIAFIRFPVVTPDDPAGPCLRVTILDADEATVTGSGCLAADGRSFIDRTILELGGTYTVRFDPDANATGTIEVRLTGATDSEGTIEVDGDTETATVTQAGAVHRLTFDADAGDAIFISFPAATPDDPEGACLRATIIDPAGSIVTGSGCLAADGSSFIDRTELALEGTYSITFDPDSEQTGSIDIQITSAN